MLLIDVELLFYSRWGTESNVHSQAVDDIVTKLLVFKIKVHPTYKRCSVIQVSEDSQVIGSLLDKIAPVMDTMTIERGKVVGGMLKEDDGFEYVSIHLIIFLLCEFIHPHTNSFM
ncbi:hypothetical protein Lalb_Chr17g0338361 [Lupinus albus]|uniref:Uncharacterized protein n=1 Tax=Lupinus albus TaxID=3870 RepID=A0A6A4NNT4_LUPAL|nr:hypothetical protein Lalb_Chr17g0338361 [Lupinus albus]